MFDAGDVEVIPLGEACGAEIRGVDLKKEISDEVIAKIQQAWNEHLVLCVRGQDLSQEDQLRSPRSAVRRCSKYLSNQPGAALHRNVRPTCVGVL
jgi:alpha-ketoglutarate-dependent taurine dioxygenase